MENENNESKCQHKRVKQRKCLVTQRSGGLYDAEQQMLERYCKDCGAVLSRTPIGARILRMNMTSKPIYESCMPKEVERNDADKKSSVMPHYNSRAYANNSGSSRKA